MMVAPLVRITAVCQQWRNLALSNRSLWKCCQVPNFTAGALSLAQEIICRSDPLPFRLQILYEGKRAGINGEMAGGEHTELLEKAPERIQALYIRSVVEFLPLLTRSLPNLSNLHLESLETSAIERYLDKSYSPNLKRLSLKNFYTIPGKLTATLTHLSLADPRRTSGLGQFLDFLRGLPLLEHLHLHQAGPVIEEPLLHANLQQVPLNALHSFAIREYESDGYPLQLLHHLHTPSLAITCWDHDFTNTWVERSPVADEMAQWAMPPCQLLQNLTCMIIRTGTANLYEVREDTIYLEAMDDGEYSTPSWLPRFLPKVQSLIITWTDIISDCGAMLGAFSTLSVLECPLESGIDLFKFKKLEREDDPWLPNLTQLTLWHDPLAVKANPSGCTSDALAELGAFSEELSNALTTSRVVVRERGGVASTFTVRLEFGDIDRWQRHSAILSSILPA